jgi:hypothetical protein
VDKSTNLLLYFHLYLHGDDLHLHFLQTVTDVLSVVYQFDVTNLEGENKLQVKMEIAQDR